MQANKPAPSLPARKVRPGLGVDDIKHIPVNNRELRFTRNRLGAFLLAAGMILGMAAVFFQIAGFPLAVSMPAPVWLMQTALIIPALLCLYVGRRCLRYAAIILTPLGIELMPFFRPRKTMRWYVWQQIQSARLRGNRLILSIRGNSAVSISLFCMTPLNRAMLCHALDQRLAALQESGYGQT